MIRVPEWAAVLIYTATGVFWLVWLWKPLGELIKPVVGYHGRHMLPDKHAAIGDMCRIMMGHGGQIERPDESMRGRWHVHPASGRPAVGQHRRGSDRGGVVDPPGE